MQIAVRDNARQTTVPTPTALPSPYRIPPAAEPRRPESLRYERHVAVTQRIRHLLVLRRQAGALGYSIDTSKLAIPCQGGQGGACAHQPRDGLTGSPVRGGSVMSSQIAAESAVLVLVRVRTPERRQNRWQPTAGRCGYMARAPLLARPSSHHSAGHPQPAPVHAMGHSLEPAPFSQR